MQQIDAVQSGKVPFRGSYIRERSPLSLYWVVFCVLLLVFGLGGTSCEAQKNRKRGKQPPMAPLPQKPVLVCRLATGDGYGKIPKYVAEFYRPGTLVYYGKRYTSKLGRYSYILPDALVKNLLLEAKKAKLMTLPEPHAAPPDAPTDTLYLLVDGKARILRFTPVDMSDALKTYTDNLRANINAILEEQEPAETPGDSTKLK